MIKARRLTVTHLIAAASVIAFAFPSLTTRSAEAQARSAAPSSSASLLITVHELDALRGNANVVLLQVGTPTQFADAHVPGARPVALNDISTPRVQGALILEVPDTPTLERWARSVGITDKSRIIVVPSNDTLQSSTRVFLTLAFMGFADRTSLLNGGLSAWRASGKPVETGEAAPIAASSGALSVKRDSSVIAVITDVDAAITQTNTAVVDARMPNFYAGQGGGYPRPGHIPTAVNIPLSLVAENGLFKSADELRALFTDAGVKPGDRVITYCHIGQQASLLWFVARQLGYDARVFDGSFQQWSGSDRALVSPTP